MEWLDQIVNGFSVVWVPRNIFFLFLGSLFGTVIGLLPGLGPSAGVALLLPVTFGMEPIPALIMLAGIYYASQYGNSISAILVNIPGTSSAAMTTLDGYPMAKNGRAGAALAIAAIGSFVAGTTGIVLLSVASIPLASFALKFGPAEYFALMVFALTAVSQLSEDSLAKGLLSAVFGLMIATIGTDMQSGLPRFTMGLPSLQDGVHFLVVVVGLFAVSEVLINIERWFHGALQPLRISGRLWLTREEWRRSVMPICRGSIIGFLVGALPGAGATIATVISYVTEKRLSKHPEQFGKGAIEGVAGPESANNASTCGSFVPLLALGVPGSDTTAVLLAVFILYGIQPGPLLFRDHPNLVWGLIDSMYLGNVMLLIMNLPLVGLFARILYIPPGILLPLIMAIATIGTYPISNSLLELHLVLVFGVIGYFFRKIAVPMTPLILAMVLGPTMEHSFRQAMTISSGDPTILVSSAISATFVGLSLLSLLSPGIVAVVKRRWGARGRRGP